MSLWTTSIEPVFQLCRRPPIHPSYPISSLRILRIRPFFLTSTSNNINNNNNNLNASFVTFHHNPLSTTLPDTHFLERSHTNIFQFNRTQMVEGKIIVRLDHGKNLRDWELIVACNLPGKWILHWGVTYFDDVGREWDQPPCDMIPPGSVPIKDYAVETPLKNSSLSAEGDSFHEVRIQLKSNSKISAINFVLKDEETGVWYKHKGRDFKVSLVNYLQEDIDNVGAKRSFNLWLGNLGQISKMFLKSKAGQDDCFESRDPKQVKDIYEEVPITRKVLSNNSISVSIKKCFESEAVKDILYFETDLRGDVVLHWGVCKDDSRRWKIPPPPHPPGTVTFKDKALRTQLQPRDDGKGSSALIPLREGFSGFIFVLKQNGNTWFKHNGNDFYVPLSSSSSLLNIDNRMDQSDRGEREVIEEAIKETSFFAFTDGINNELKNMVKEKSSEKSEKIKSKKAQQSIFQEIERLAAEAINMFRSSIPTFLETTTTVEPEVTIVVEPEANIVEPKATTTVVPEASEESDTLTLGPKICSGTGTRFEILCQGFNWESHKSGRWYTELKDKASELASLGFTMMWLPPPTESVSPEGYMPKDLYNLNSRYGNIDELKDLVKRFHEVGIKVLGDVILNHRCAHYQNQNGIWNIFGGRLNWDDRAIVADDPLFQGRGNRSSGDNFHAAPNIDHSQEFVRRDLKEWLCWLSVTFRKEIGYDGWRLDFARGFWGGYVKEYVDGSEPYFAVGEYWDSLNYMHGEMDHNQDAHRQRIVDWISATNGTAAAFDVTTKGILHSALERYEYWRLSDQKGKPPGVIGWWPSRAVTFIENHDTGSTQGHWRFPCGKEMQGYTYILTHPGTPSVFFDHIFSHYKTEISTLIYLRKRKMIHCRSTVQIVKAERDVYAAIIDEKIAMKIGPGPFEPTNDSHKWSLVIEGNDYKIWEAS